MSDVDSANPAHDLRALLDRHAEEWLRVVFAFPPGDSRAVRAREMAAELRRAAEAVAQAARQESGAIEWRARPTPAEAAAHAARAQSSTSYGIPLGRWLCRRQHGNGTGCKPYIELRVLDLGDLADPYKDSYAVEEGGCVFSDEDVDVLQDEAALWCPITENGDPPPWPGEGRAVAQAQAATGGVGAAPSSTQEENANADR